LFFNERLFPSFKDTYIWSSNQIIAASSNRKICLYHPLNGFTRALDITGRVALAFSTNGDRLAMAYRKSKRMPNDYELFMFKMQHSALFKSEKLDTEKVRTEVTDDITALCFTKNDTFLMCGSANGKIYALESIKDPDKNINRWTIFKVLNESHSHEVFKICFSATYQYMASIDIKGEFKIWNGGSFTHIFSYLKEESRMYRHFEWHPYVENEFIFGRIFYPAIFLFNVTERKIVAGFMNWKDDWELSSIAFNPVNGQLAVCFYNEGEKC
jgi:WD40 repeat protein